MAEVPNRSVTNGGGGSDERRLRLIRPTRKGGPPLRVRDIMSSPAVTVSQDTAVNEAAILLSSHGFTALPGSVTRTCSVAV